VSTAVHRLCTRLPERVTGSIFTEGDYGTRAM
jgi:hypothetical protein